jgi:hypothetical protein
MNSTRNPSRCRGVQTHGSGLGVRVAVASRKGIGHPEGVLVHDDYLFSFTIFMMTPARKRAAA